MWIAVIPAHNEADSIGKVLENLHPCNFYRIMLVANGCDDLTEETALHSVKIHHSTEISQSADINQPAGINQSAGIRQSAGINQPTGIGQLELLSFPEPLGLDVPRAIGAAYARKHHPQAQGVVFIDGDLLGAITAPVLDLLKGLDRGLDLALTNCYPHTGPHSDLAATVLQYRETVNKKLGLATKIGLATPSHGPHALSARLLTKIPPQVLAIPPLTLAWTALHNFKIDVAAAIPHELLGSKFRSTEHASQIAATIIDDCQQALAYLEGTPLTELFADAKNLTGYRKLRRFDLLEAFLAELESPGSS